MTPSEHEQRLDQAFDDLLDGDSSRLSADIDPELQELLPIAHEVQAALAYTPPPPHGLRPGRSAFLTAAAAQGTKSSRFNLPNISRTLGWIAPAAAILVFALVLMGLFQDNIRPPVLPTVQPLAQPARTVSTTPTLLPAPALVSSPTSTPIKGQSLPTLSEPVSPAADDIPSARNGRKSPTAAASLDTSPNAETTQQPPSTESTPTAAQQPADQEPTPTSTAIIMPTASVSASEPEYTPTTTPTLTPTVANTVTKSPTPVPTRQITPPVPVTPEPVPLTVTPKARPTSTPGSQDTPPAPSPTPNGPTETPQVKHPTVTPPPSS